MKSFQQVRDILSHVHRVRARMRLLTEDYLEETHDELLAGYLAQAAVHDAFMHRCLAGEVDEAPPAALNTWVQYADIKPLAEDTFEQHQNEHSSSQAILDKLLAVDQRILEIYQSVRQRSESQAVRDLFDRLCLMEEQKTRAKAWGQVELSDLESY